MTEKEKMLSGELYNPSDPELKEEAKRSRRLVTIYNNTAPEQKEYRN